MARKKKDYNSTEYFDKKVDAFFGFWKELFESIWNDVVFVKQYILSELPAKKSPAIVPKRRKTSLTNPTTKRRKKVSN